eukprot:365024_1
MSKRRLSDKKLPANKRRKRTAKNCEELIKNELESLFARSGGSTATSGAKPFHFCCGEIKVSSDNFLQIFIPKHTPSTIRYQGNNLLSQNCNAKTWKDLYESKDITVQSPVGIGEQTVIDTSLRSSKELKADQFDLSGQEFEIHDSRTNVILKQVKECLAPYCPYITAMKYKLMIYAKNDFFTTHKDTYRGDGNIGTLLLLIPTAYKGGQLVLKHNQNTKEFKGSNKKTVVKWVAFYGDVDHQILKITSGYRVSVSYNLYVPPNTKLDALESREWMTNTFNRNLCDNICGAMENGKDGVIFVLDHEYVTTEMMPSRLKGKDLELYTAMCGCDKLKFSVQALETERSEYNGDDEGWYHHGDDDWDYDEETQALASGDSTANYIIIGDVYQNKSIDDESGPTGNEGQTRELSYRCTTMIVTQNDDNQQESKNKSNSNSKQ